MKRRILMLLAVASVATAMVVSPVLAQQELPRGIEDAAPVEDLSPSGDEAVKPVSTQRGVSDQGLAQRDENAGLNGTPLTSETPGPSERAPEQANLAPSGNNCTFEGGRTNCVTTTTTTTTTQETSETTSSCTVGQGKNAKAGTQTTTTTKTFDVITTTTTTDEFAGRSGNLKDTNTETKTETVLVNEETKTGPCKPNK